MMRLISKITLKPILAIDGKGVNLLFPLPCHYWVFCGFMKIFSIS